MTYNHTAWTGSMPVSHTEVLPGLAARDSSLYHCALRGGSFSVRPVNLQQFIKNKIVLNGLRRSPAKSGPYFVLHRTSL